MKRLLNEVKALRTLRKNPLILRSILQDVTQEQATTLRDGPDGWSVLFILCHLADIETIFTNRVRDLLARPNTNFTVVTNEELMHRRDYAAQDFAQELATYCERRAEFIGLLTALSDEQWALVGTHPDQGPATLLEVAVNSGLHDIDHIEQLIRCLEPLGAMHV